MDLSVQRYLVSALSAPPVRLPVSTLADLSALASDPAALRDAVARALEAVDERGFRRGEGGEAAEAAAILDEAIKLGYPPLEAGAREDEVRELSRAVVEGDTALVYPLLRWLLSNAASLRRRAYVARFLRPAAVPEQYFADEAVVEQYALYRELQAEFKEVHRAMGRDERVDPVRMQRDIERLDLERGQLAAKMERLRERVRADAEGGPVPFDALLAATRALRTEQEEEARLLDSLEEQRNGFYVSERRREDLGAELEELRRASGEEPARLLARLRAEVEAAEGEAAAADAEAASREQQLRELEGAAAGEPMNEDDVAELERETGELQRRVAELTEARDRHQSSMDGQVGFYRDRATAVEAKRKRLEERVRELEEDLREAERDLRAASDELGRGGGGGGGGIGPACGVRRPQTDAEVKEYVRLLTAKTERYKEAKARLQALVSEGRVLQHTEEVLRSRDANIAEFNRELEARHGVEGYTRTQETLEQVSAEKGRLDAEKGDALAEMSRAVDEFHRTVRAKKETLAPAIKAFREARAEFREVEREHAERKRANDTTAAGLGADLVEAEREARRNRAALQAEESNYHFLTSARCVTEARLRMLDDEERFVSSGGAERLSAEHATYAELFAAETKRMEQESRALRKQQKSVKRDHGGNVEQRRRFKELRALLEAKAEARRVAAAEPADGLGVVNEEENFIQFG